MPSGGEALRVAFTGGRGFAGSRLRAAIAARHPAWTLAAPGIEPEFGGLDVADAEAMDAWIARERPDVVVHLAAVSAVTASDADPRTAWRINLDGALNLVLALRQHAPAAHLLHVSSAEVYGASAQPGVRLTEGALLQPVNTYAASKAAADILVREAAAGGLSSTVMRPFNHMGAGQSDAFVAPAFARQIAEIEAGLRPPVLKVGGLDDERDFLDVDDVAAAYLAAIDARGRLEPGEVFNVASGRAVSIRGLLDRLLALSDADIRVEEDPARLRPGGPRSMTGDASRLTARTGWAPSIAFGDTLARLLDHERARARGA